MAFPTINASRSLKNKAALVGLAAMAWYLSWLIFFRLDALPGLHADEARFGLASINVINHGITTIHGVNERTGAAYPWLVSLAFRMAGVNVLALRSVGAVANLAGLALLAWSLHRYRSRKAVAAFLLIVLASPFFVINARVGWEVTALQFLLISIQISILLHAAHHGSMGLKAGLAFAITSSLGVFNHFIFLSNVTAFMLGSASAYLLSRPGSRQHAFSAQLLHLSLLIFLFSGFVVVVKPIIGDAQRTWLVAIIIFTAFVLCFHSFTTHSSEALCDLFIDRPCKMLTAASNMVFPRMRRLQARHLGLATIIVTIALVGLMANQGQANNLWHSYVRHFWGLLGSLTSVLPLQRIMRHRIGAEYTILAHGFWLLLLGLYLAMTLRVVLAAIRRTDTDSSLSLIFFLYPLFAFAVLPVFVKISSERYYLIVCYLFVACFPILLGSQPPYRLLPAQRAIYPLRLALSGLALLLALGYLVSAQFTILASVLRNGTDDVGSQITYPGYQDTSLHFADTARLHDYLNSQKMCDDIATNFFIRKPLKFYRAIDGTSCSGRRVTEIRYCETCLEPVRFFRVLIKER
jgi:hypothetical protein